MRYRSPYRRHLTGAMIVAALIVHVPTSSAQPTQAQSKRVSGIDEAVKALDSEPRLKKLSREKKKSSWNSSLEIHCS